MNDIFYQSKALFICININFRFGLPLKGVQRPAAFAIVCFCFCEFRTVSYSGRCGEQYADFTQSMLVFVLPLKNTLRLVIKLNAWFLPWNLLRFDFVRFDMTWEPFVNSLRCNCRAFVRMIVDWWRWVPCIPAVSQAQKAPSLSQRAQGNKRLIVITLRW